MRYSKCCVPGCGNLRQDVKLHKFPKDKKRLQMWLDSINCDSLCNLSVEELARLQVCHKHFEKKFVTEKSRILAIAYPTLFTDEEITTGVSLSPALDSGNIDLQSEHAYSRKRHVDHSYYATLSQPSTSSILDVATISSHIESAEQSTTITQEKFLDVATTSSHEECLQQAIIVTQGNVSDVATTSSHEECLQQAIIVTQGNVSEMPSQSKIQQREKRKRLVRTVESLTPKCKQLYKEYRKSKKLLNYTRRARKALRFTKEHAFEEHISKLNPFAQKMLLMQVRLCTKEAKGRRFTLEEKLIALSIMKQSPKSYRFLQKIFILPSKTTLKRIVQKLDVCPGINPQIFQSIKKEVETSIQFNFS